MGASVNAAAAVLIPAADVRGQSVSILPVPCLAVHDRRSYAVYIR